jgi:non-canonical purine NTP pyrophosphatase (RdgB/HAM1 family)
MPDNAARLLAEATLVTGNPGKLAEARRLCEVEMAAAAIDLPEIQSLDIREILEAKAVEAFHRLERPVVVDETALDLAALNGFPGVLIKWMLESVGAEGIAQIAYSLGNTRANARCALLYFTDTDQVFVSGSTSGQLILPPRGANGFGWDPIFQPDHQHLTYAELTGSDKDHISHRGKAWRTLKGHLAESDLP